MRQIHIGRLFYVASFLTTHKTGPYTQGARNELVAKIPRIKERSRLAGLPLLAPACDRIIGVLPDGSDEEIQGAVTDLHTRMFDALHESLFMQFLPHEVDLYERPFTKWEPTIERFPTAATDIDEASKCLACHRGTACVFHLTRYWRLAFVPSLPDWVFLTHLAGTRTFVSSTRNWNSNRGAGRFSGSEISRSFARP